MLEPAPDLPLTGFLTYRIARLHLALNAQAADALSRRSELSLGQWRALATIGAGAETARDVARMTRFDPAFVSRALKSLSATGLVETERPPEDRRMLSVRLTAEGERLYERLLPHMRGLQERLLDALTPDEAAAMFRMIDKLDAAAATRADGSD